METWQVNEPAVLVGRTNELAVLHSAVRSVLNMEGSVVWVEGDPGIGKTAIVAAAAEAAVRAGISVYWAAADQFSQQLPLRVILDCFRVPSAPSDPRLIAINDAVTSNPCDRSAIKNALYPATNLLLSFVDEISAVTPSLVVVDNLQWCDEASLTVWHRLSLAVHRLPVLLIGVCQSNPRRLTVRELRASIRSCGGTLLAVGPLDEKELLELAANVIGTIPDMLVPLVSGAMGNPRYVQELLRATRPDGDYPARVPTEVSRFHAAHPLPRRFVAGTADLLRFLSDSAVEMLRAATLFGHAFAVADVAALLGRSVLDLFPDLQEVIATGLIADTQSQLTFHHPLIRQALYESMPTGLRSALHQEAARVLADARAEPTMVAAQLALAGRPGSAWVPCWLAGAIPTLATRSPELAIDVIERELNNAGLPSSDRAFLALALTRTLLRHGRLSQAVAQAHRALASAEESPSRAEALWLLARAMTGLGDYDRAVQAIEVALGEADLPDGWRARLLTLRSMLQPTNASDVDAADIAGNESLRAALAANDRFAVGYALTGLWRIEAVRRDHRMALIRIDRALATLGKGLDDDDLRVFLVDCRIFTLQNLDRWAEAETTALDARLLAQRDNADLPSTRIATAVLMYWLGRWDDALAELATVDDDLLRTAYRGLYKGNLVPLRHGVSALVAAHRDDRQAAENFLRFGREPHLSTPNLREHNDFLLAAQALLAEQEGDSTRALDLLSAVIAREPGEMTLTHQWLPDLVRLALAIGDEQTARAGLAACHTETAAESSPARASAAHHRCQGLVDRDANELRLAVAHYREFGLKVELAGALEDLAEVLAEHGHTEEARTALNQAIHGYTDLGASWDVRRAERRLRVRGIRRGVHGARPPHPTVGWGALTHTERKVACRVAGGQSTIQIADGMQLSRRTVQTHISHILTKLEARSRVDIVREALRQGAAAFDDIG